MKNAPYNPRQKLSRHKKLKLEKNLRSVGLVATVVWNRRTGNLVGGHQRLAALDSLESSGDYELDVAVVDLDERTERAQNVFLNNPLVQGTWDMKALGELMRADDFDVQASGFDPMDVQVMFDDPELAPLFNGESNDAVIQEISKIGAMTPRSKVEEAAGMRRPVAAAQLADFGDDEEPFEDGDDDERPRMAPPPAELPDTSEAQAAERAKWAEIKARQQARVQEQIVQDDTEFYAVVGFADARQRAVFCQMMGVDPKASYIEGARVQAKLKTRVARP